MALGQVDGELVSQLQGLVSRYDTVDQETQPEKWDPTKDSLLKMEHYHKYKGELYGLIVSLVGGEVLGWVKGLRASIGEGMGVAGLGGGGSHASDERWLRGHDHAPASGSRSS